MKREREGEREREGDLENPSVTHKSNKGLF